MERKKKERESEAGSRGGREKAGSESRPLSCRKRNPSSQQKEIFPRDERVIEACFLSIWASVLHDSHWKCDEKNLHQVYEFWGLPFNFF